MNDLMDFERFSMDMWRLCDELNVIQASLLVSGNDPSAIQDYVEKKGYNERPAGYEAVKAALSRALISGKIEGKLAAIPDYDMNGHFTEFIDGSVDLEKSIIDVDDLKKWLSSRGFESGFFFPEGAAKADFLNPKHPRYSAKLAASANAWVQVGGDGVIKGKTVKQSLEKWLRLHAAEYGLCDEDGKPNEKGIDECAKVANWQQKGGAPKTP